MIASNPALGVTRAVLVALLAGGAALPGCGEAEQARAPEGLRGVVVCAGSQPPAALGTAQREQVVEQVRTLVERAAGSAIPLYWTYLRAPGSDAYAPPDRTRPGTETLLTIELESIRPSVQSYASCDGAPGYLVPATLRATTQDALIDATFENMLVVRTDATGTSAIFTAQAMPGFATPRFEDALRSFGVEPDHALQVLSVTFTEQGVRGEMNLHAVPDIQLPEVLFAFASFSSAYPAVKRWDGVAIPDLLAATCQSALATADRTPFVADTTSPRLLETWLEHLSGRWALCGGKGTRPADHAGLVISSDMLWHHLAAQDGKLVELRGRDHEGWALPGVRFPIPASDVQIQMRGLAPPLDEASFVATLSRDFKVMTLSGGDAEGATEAIEYVYVAISDQAVAAARPPRAAGERAGETGCTEPSAYLSPRAGSAQELEAELGGAWSLCGTSLDPGATSLRFEPTSRRYELRRADGSLIRSGTYGANSGEMIELALDGAPNGSYSRVLEHVMVFDAPKLLQFWLAAPGTLERERHVLSALP